MFLKKYYKNTDFLATDSERKNKNDIIKLFSFDSNLFKKEKSQENNERLNIKSMSINKKAKSNVNKKQHSNNSQCPLDKNCPYYKKYLNLKNQLIMLLFSINKENNFNQSLIKSLSKKTTLYYNLISENEELKKTLNQITNKRIYDLSIDRDKKFNNDKNEISRRTDTSFKSFSLKNNNNYTLTENNHLKKNFKISKSIITQNLINETHFSKKLVLKKNIKIDNSINNHASYDKKKVQIKNDPYKKRMIKKYVTNKNLRGSIISINSDPNNHYELLQSYSNLQNKKFIGDSSKFSFLSSNVDYPTIIKNNSALMNLESLTKNDELFLQTMSDSSDESLLKYSDMIASLINDYKEMIKLGIRMKDLIKGSNKFVDSIIDSNPSKILIDNTCLILNCDRASLFLLDKNSDSLIVYTGEGIKKAQIKIPKDKGIIGSCFMEMKKIRIDDAYLDNRFNKEVDKRTNYRTKSILCYPLIDRSGDCFGVIEAINKIISNFNEDDEEFLKILAYQASIIFNNFSTDDDNRFLNKKLNIIIDYNIDINYLKNKFEFSEKTEETLLILFNCVESAFYFIEDNIIKRYKDNKIYNYDINIGIIGKVIKTKEIVAFENTKNCVNFNSIIDLNTSDGILTFPILSKKNKNVRAVAQVPYLGKILKNGKPNENQMKIIKKFRKCIKNWFEINII